MEELPRESAEDTPEAVDSTEVDTKKQRRKKKRRASLLGASVLEQKRPETPASDDDRPTANTAPLIAEGADNEPSTAAESATPLDAENQEASGSPLRQRPAERSISGDEASWQERVEEVWDEASASLREQLMPASLQPELASAEGNTDWVVEEETDENLYDLPSEEPVSVREPVARRARPRAAANEVRSNVFTPTTAEVLPSRRGKYARNIPAGGSYKPEHVPFTDELLLRNLPGGMTGYLVGRQRGKTQTERTLRPKQQKLEKRLKTLERTILASEPAAQPRSKEIVMESKPTSERNTEPAVEAAAVVKAVRESRQKSQPEARPAPVRKAPERLGHVVVDAERRQPEKKPSRKSEQPFDKPEKIAIDPRQSADMLTRAELLAISDKVTVEGTTLRNIYETHLIGERGLRRLVSEHLKDGDVNKVLKHEISERELDFERDPILRDRVRAAHAESAPASTLLQTTEPSVAESREEAAFYKARAKYEVKQRAASHRQRRLLDVSMTATITALLALVIYLLLQR